MNENASHVPTQWIRCHVLKFISGTRVKRGRRLPEPMFHEARARLVLPNSGTVLSGTLVDCPEVGDHLGCVVIEAGAELLAVQSRALRDLIVENAPCSVEIVAVLMKSGTAETSWDWDCYELSPNGGRFLVSEPRDRI